MSRRFVIGVDVGGTFTDLFFLDQSNGRCSVGKVPTTRPDQSVGFLAGIRGGVDGIGEVATVVHGTTVGTNALLERRGAPTGIITTEGFRDVLEMRRRDRPTTWGLWGQYVPVVPRDRRLEVPERTLADGTVHTAVDLDAAVRAAQALREAGCEAIAIAFINAHASAANESAALEAVRSVWPNEHVTASHRILPEIREFERTSTATLNAYLQPVIGNYLHRLEGALQADGFGGAVLIVQSNGGVMTVETARRVPVRTALSGPAAGAIAGAHIASEAGFPNVITCDMGGTSFDVSLIVGGASALTPEASVDFGMVVRQPMIEITTIGAGGGSIASVDRSGLLQVGPESAGSDPGPVCYGLGNDRPTVTDANLVLGRINAERPIGGGLERLDVEAATRAIAREVGEPLGLSAVEAAEAIVRVANAKMAGAIRLVSIERGHDPKSFAAMPFGGGGALHAGALMREVGLASALVPRFPGVTSAIGCVIADMRHDFVRTVNRTLDGLDAGSLGREAAAMRAEGLAMLDRSGIALEGRETILELDMSYLGQTHTVAVRLPIDEEAPDLGMSVEAIREAFESRYREAYGRVLEGLAIRILNLRVAVIGRRPKLDISVLAPGPEASEERAHLGRRNVYVDGAWCDATVYDRLALPVGAVVAGPAVLEQSDTTIFVDPGLAGRVDTFGNLVIERVGDA